jgi:hypothetical protein
MGTALPHDLDAWQRQMQARAVPPDEAYRRAVAAERGALLGVSGADPAPGFGLYAVTDGSLQRCDVGVRGDRVIIGRHTACDLVLPSDMAISLRHAIVRVWALDDGLPLFGLQDLDSGAGFELVDRSRQRAIVASGPLVFRIGVTWFVALPRGERLPDELSPSVIQQSDASSYKVDPHAELRALPNGPRPDRPTSRITVVPHSVHCFEPRSAAPAWVPMPGSSAEPQAFEIRLEKDGRGAGIRVSDRDVGHGVLIGRDLRCVDAGLRTIMNEGISRIHALVIRERTGVKLYDLASTNGISYEGQRARCIPLSNAGTTVFLHGMGPIAMRWRALA